MKKLLTAFALKFIGNTTTKLAKLDESKAFTTFKQGVDVADRGAMHAAKMIYWLKVAAYSFILMIVLLVINLGVMLFT